MDSIKVHVSDGQGIVPSTYKTIILKPNIVNGKNMLTQAMFAQTDAKYIIKYDYVINADIVTKSVQVLSSNISQCVNPAYTKALAYYNKAHDAWIDTDNAYTNNPNNTTLAAKNAAYAAYNTAHTTLNNTPQYYYYSDKVISLHKGQHIIIPDNCVLLNSSLNALAGFEVAPTDSMVYIGNPIPDIYKYTIQEAIEIPNRCLIEFDGGSLNNGIIIGNDTIICSSPTIIFKENLAFSGTWLAEDYFSEWFGGDVQKCLDVFNNVSFINNTILDTPIIIKNFASINFKSNISVTVSDNFDDDYLFIVDVDPIHHIGGITSESIIKNQRLYFMVVEVIL